MKLGKFICKGLKYVENKAVELRVISLKVLINMLRSLSHRKPLPETLLTQWKSTVSDCVKEKKGANLQFINICFKHSQGCI